MKLAESVSRYGLQLSVDQNHGYAFGFFPKPWPEAQANIRDLRHRSNLDSFAAFASQQRKQSKLNCEIHQFAFVVSNQRKYMINLKFSSVFLPWAYLQSYMFKRD